MQSHLTLHTSKIDLSYSAGFDLLKLCEMFH